MARWRAVVLSRSRRSGMHLAPRSRRRWVRRMVVVLLVVALLVVVTAVRMLTVPVPSLHTKRVVASSVTIPGTQPVLAWPAGGQAAAEVLGLGTLGSSPAQTRQPIASLAKVMTAYVVLRDHPLRAGQDGFTLTVSAADVADYQSRLAQAQSVLPVATGERLTELQLLEGLLVASANNVGPMLARYDARSETAFVSRMQATARTLGMADTTYTDPSGFASTTVSTAADQLRLADRAMTDPVFARVVAMPSADLPVAGVVTNFDRAVGTNGYVGIKTGADSDAGGCLMFANRWTTGGRSMTAVGVVLGLRRGDSSTGLLLDAAFTAADSLVASIRSVVGAHTVLAAGTVVETVGNGARGKVDVATTAPLVAVGWAGQTLAVDVTPLSGPVRAGQKLATVSVGGASSPAVAATGLRSPSWTWRLKHVL